MPYGRYRRRRPSFRRTRGRTAYRPTAVRRTKVSYYRRKLRRYQPLFAARKGQFAKLVWQGTYDHNFASSPGFVDTVCRLNSLYDPQYALGGGTPTGLTALAAVWGQYKVCGAKVTCRFVNTGTLPARVGFYACDDSYTTPSTAALNQAQLMEMGNPNFVILPAAFGSSSTVTLRRFYRIKNIMGRSRYQDQNAVARVTADPYTQAHLHVVSLSDLASVAPGATSTTRVYITIKFYAKFMVNNSVALD